MTVVRWQKNGFLTHSHVDMGHRMSSTSMSVGAKFSRESPAGRGEEEVKKTKPMEWWPCPVPDHESTLYFMLPDGLERTSKRHFHNNAGQTFVEAREVLPRRRKK